MLKLTDYEILRRAALLRADLIAGGAKLHLFVNNVVPDETFTLASLTEATFPGYPGAPALDFTGSIATIAAHVASFEAAPITFTRSAGAGGENVYGYYVVDAAGTNLLWAERDPAAPLDMSIPGATYTVTVRNTGTDQ